MDTLIHFKLYPSLFCLGVPVDLRIRTAWKPSLSSLKANQSSLYEHVCLICLAMPGFTLEGLPVCGHTLASAILMNEGGQEEANKGRANEHV